MKIIVASCVFPPEPIVSARTSFDVANFLHSEGHDVTVVCPKPHRNIVDVDSIQLELPFTVKRLFSFSSGKSSFVSRFIENISFGLSLFFYILKQKKVDVIYANTWPIFASGLLLLAAKIKKIKVVISIQDLYPESLIVQGRIGNDGVVARFLLLMDRWIAQNSHHVIVISEGFKDIYMSSRGIAENNLTIIKNWVNSDAITVIDTCLARKQLNKEISLNLVDGDMLCVYGGNIGAASGLDVFIEYIDKIDPKFKFIFAGDGTHLPLLRNHVRDNKLMHRVGFISPWPDHITSSVLCSADILLLPTAEGQEFASVPSKLITYMMSSKPILLIADKTSQIAEEVKRANCGYVVSERSIEALDKCLLEFSNLDSAQRCELGDSGRKYALVNYSFLRAVSKINQILMS
jgi:colanic acid biosynthesis glycosyl transferase WcaI